MEMTTIGTTVSTTGDATSSTVYDVTMTELAAEEEAPRGAPWEGVLAIEGHPTSDGRYLLPGEIDHRDLPFTLLVQTKTADGHDGAEVAGRIEAIEMIPVSEFNREGFDIGEVTEGAKVIWGTGTLDTSEFADDARRLMENGAGISIDMPPERIALIDPETLEEVPEDDVDFEDIMFGNYLTGIGGKIAAATVCTIPAFEEARISLSREHALVASAYGFRVLPDRVLVASAAPVKPPRDWFDDPQLPKLTPLTITPEGRVFGHLCDWDGCHTGFGNVCVPPIRSMSNYANFNVAEIETSEGDFVPTGKLMFSRTGAGHADTSPSLSANDVRKHYDDATKVGAYVRAGEDRFGTFIVGCLRPDLSEEDVQHLRLHPPSGDWRPIPGKGSDLVAAFSVPVPGFPIPRVMIASGSEGLAIITGPLVIEVGDRERIRRMAMLRERMKAARAAE